MKTCIIFLDMDGVMNHTKWFAVQVAQAAPKNYEDLGWWIDRVDPDCVERLNKIVEATGAKVVISSSWRYDNKPDEMQEILRIRGFKGEVIGQTPFLTAEQMIQGMQSRGDEIKVWLAKNSHLNITDYFVILDDLNPRNFTGLEDHLIKTKGATGLLDEHITQAINILNGEK